MPIRHFLVICTGVLVGGRFASSTNPLVEDPIAAEETEGHHDILHQSSNADCRLYLAESLVGSGWGVFAGHDLHSGDEFVDDPSILLPDMDWMEDVPELQFFQALTRPSQIHMGSYEANHVDVV